MKRAGAARRRALIALCPPGRLVIDIGADHGHVAWALGAIATERMPHRLGKAPVRWVVADGLSCFSAVDVAIIAGMGAVKISGILASGPTPAVLIAHAADDPPHLRRWLAANGWRIDAESLAPEANRFAEVLRAVPGKEAATGIALELGPRLLEGDDPHLRAHLEHTLAYWADIAAKTAAAAPDIHHPAAHRVQFLRQTLARRGWR